jgi:hypothetical protein
VRRGAKHAYYALRPLMPRPVQIALRRRLAAVQQRSAFPRWPAEPALHDLYDLLFGLLAEVAGEPLPRIAAWPDGRSWALVLTHDVETAAGHGNVAPLRERELRHGVRSAWNFVPLRYAVDDALVADLLADGFEVGVHGLHHDGRDIAPQALERRLPQMRSYAARWHATGFRSPALGHDAEPRLRARQLVPRHGPVRARRGRLLLVAADAQRRDGRAARHARPGPHALRDPPPRRAGRVVREDRGGPRARRHGAPHHPPRLHVRRVAAGRL